MKLLSIILIFLYIELWAISEGIAFRGKKELGKIVKIIWVLSGMLIWWRVGFSWWLIAEAALCKLLFFGVTWNLAAGQPVNYIGKGLWDRFVEKYIRTSPVWYFLLFLFIITISKYSEK